MNAKISFGSLTKLINIVFLIVLENFVLDGAMGLFSVPLVLYYVIYTIFFSSLQAGIAKMVSIRNNKGINGNAKRIVKPALSYVVIAGALITGIVYLIMETSAVSLFKVTYPVPVILILCMVLILNGITDVLCGYHIGNGNGGVANIINVLKMIFPIVFSVFVIRSFSGYGEKISALLKNAVVVDAYAAMGIATVYAMTAVLMCLVVVVLTIYTRKYSKIEKSVRGIDSRRSVAGGFLTVNSRIMMNHIFWVLSIGVCTILYLKSVMKTELSIADAYTNIGVLFTRVLLPVLLVMIIFAEYIAKEKHRLHIDYRKDEYKTMVVRTQYMIKNTLFMLLPPTMILVFLAGSIAKEFYNGQVVLASKYLHNGGCILLLAGLSYALCSIMSAFDKEKTVWVIQGGSLIAQIIFLLIGFSKSNADSMMILYSFYLYFGIQICAFFVLVYTTVRLDLLDIMLKLGKYGVAGIIMMILYIILEKFVSMNIFLVFLSVFLGYLLYYLTLIALHGISKKDEAALKRTLNYYPVHFLRSRLRL